MRFCKMQGAGNDFIVLNNLELKIPGDKLNALSAHVCRRRMSLGANALMTVEPAQHGGDFRMRYFNSDGSEGEMCGNGARCIARFAYDAGIAKSSMVIETLAGDVPAWRIDKRRYKLLLNEATVIETGGSMEVAGSTYACDYIELGSPGIPHAVVRCNNLETLTDEELTELGRAFRYHQRFPKGANINFYKVLGPGSVLLKTYERGVEELTLACGTGSGSTVVALAQKGEVGGGSIAVFVPGGTLEIELETDSNGKIRPTLTGDTNRVAEGIITDEDLKN